MPTLGRRAPHAAAVQPAKPPVAALACDGTLTLNVDGVSTPLSEAAPGPSQIAPTRAGTTMTIDYALVGSVDNVVPRSKALSPCSPTEGSEAADESNGLRYAVLRWGSDHLPVACDTWWMLS